jgi:hypothetical protein
MSSCQVFFPDRAGALENHPRQIFKHNYRPRVKVPQSKAALKRVLDDGKQIVLASSVKGDELQTYKNV